jgi:ribosomal protein S18 acetylase RimI-like enzyme
VPVAESSIGEYSLRPPRDDDLLPILEVVNEAERAEFGAAWLTEADLRAFWSLVDRDRDEWVVAAPDGRLVASAAVQVSQPVQIRAFVSILPAHYGRGIGSELLRRAEERAREVVPKAPPGARVSIRQSVGTENDGARRLLEANGYAFVRRFWTMGLDLDDEPPPPRWPRGVRVAPLGAGEERSVFDAMEEAFQDHWGHVPDDFDEWRVWTIEREGFDPTLWRLVWDGEELAAASLNAVRRDEGWVNVLGVRRPWRRRGLALALLHESFREFRRRGLPRVLLGVDSENPTGATRLYERAGMHVTRTADAYEKLLREETGP